MLIITKDKKIDIMRGTNAPVARMESGDTAVFETQDCFDGTVLRDGSRENRQRMANLATGPLYINGAQPGDVLKVEVLSIETVRWGIMCTGFGENAFKDVEGEDGFFVYEYKDNSVDILGNSIPVKPMIGVIGTAAAGEGVPTVTPGSHGGNMDCSLITEGAVLYLPVFCEGGLLAMGDLHALMGDGEVFGCGLETSGTVRVRVSVIKDFTLNMPLLKQNDSVMAIASHETMEGASTLAIGELYRLLTSNGADKTQAGMLMSLVCDLAVCQMVDPLMTVRACMNESYFKLP